MLFVLIIFIGAIIGILTTLFGIGGGLVVVPVLMSFFKSTPFQVATATSLSFAFFNSLINNIKFYKSGANINYKDALKFSLSSLVGAFLGGILVSHLNLAHFKIYFSILLLIIAIRMIIPKKLSEKPKIELRFIYQLAGIFGGCFSTLTGLGGGIIFAPLLLTFTNLHFKQVSPYSNLAITLGCFSGLLTQIFYNPTFIWNDYPFLNQFQFGPVNFGIAILFLMGSVFTSGIGIKYNNIINERTKNLCLFSILIIVIFKTVFFS